MLMHMLRVSKHNGAVSKAARGLEMLARRLLNSGDPALAALPASWMERQMVILEAPNQARDGRRSGNVATASKANRRAARAGAA